MNEYINNDNGTVSLDENVVAQVAGMTALDCFGIVGMGIVSVKDGIVKQLKGNNITQGIHVTFDENGDIVVELHIVVEYGVSINTFLTGIFAYSIYKEHLHSQPYKKPISICVPVNMRPFYGSITTKNFFGMTAAVLRADKENYTVEEVIARIDESLKEQITKENMDSLISYNVSNQKNLMLRMVPLFVKNLAMKWVYRSSALANTSTVTNVGSLQIREDYRPYIDKMHVVLSMTKGQNMKCSISSYEDTLVYTISSKLKDQSIQKCFFRTLSELGVPVTIETNGEAYEVL